MLRSLNQTRAERRQLAQVARGERPADVVVRGGTLLNVYTRERYPADVVISGSRIAAVGPDVAHLQGDQTQMIDAAGALLVPGFIDTHSHVHESQLTISEYARAVLARGTTSVSTDFYGELVVGGVDAVRACMEAARATPLKLLYMLGTPGFYQNHPFGHSGWPTLEQMLEMLEWPECVGMDDSFAAYIADAEPQILELVDAVQERGLWVSSHGAELTGGRLQAWVAYLGQTDDHESVTASDGVERARLGVYVTVREGAACYNLEQVIGAVTEHGVDPRRFCFNTDVPSSVEIHELGHIDHNIRKAISLGLDPVTAVQMATLNAAECLSVQRDLGAVSPGKVADIVFLGDLEQVAVERVMSDGRIVAEGGVALDSYGQTRFPDSARSTVRLRERLTAAHFEIPAEVPDGVAWARVIVASGQSVTTQETTAHVRVLDGRVQADPAADILKIAAVERVTGTGQIGVGLVTGFGLAGSCALATTFNSQQQNCIVVGTTERDMAVAVNTLAEVGGGFVAVRDGQVAGLLELPLYGLLSERPYEEVVAALGELNAVVRSLGCDMPSPFPTLGFVGLPVDIGHLKICPEGLIDVWSRSVVEVLTQETGARSG